VVVAVLQLVLLAEPVAVVRVLLLALMVQPTLVVVVEQVQIRHQAVTTVAQDT
jgi:hypothetical protein